ncbi:hypothetical protein ABIA31_001257 [Catenulispora sp. MAP5-51]
MAVRPASIAAEFAATARRDLRRISIPLPTVAKASPSP